MDPVEYWRSRAMEASQEYEQVLQSQRDEIERLQRRCTDLLHERSMMKAATAADVRNFCLNYQADQQRKKGLTSSSAVEDIPVHTLMMFLHTYSNGLLPAPENKRKRNRFWQEEEGEGSSSPSSLSRPGGKGPLGQAQQQQQQQQQHRLYQRMLARQRTTGRLEEFQDEQTPTASDGNTAFPSSVAHPTAASSDDAQQQSHSDPNAPHLAQDLVRAPASGGDGSGGPVISAYTFGLPSDQFPK